MIDKRLMDLADGNNGHLISTAVFKWLGLIFNIFIIFTMVNWIFVNKNYNSIENSYKYMYTLMVLIIGIPLIPISIIAVQKIAKKKLNAYWKSYTSLGNNFLENLYGLTTLKIFKADERMSERMSNDAEEFRIATMNVLKMQLYSITVMDLIAYGGATIGIGISILEYAKGTIEISQLLVIILLSSEFFISMRLLGSFFHIAMNGMAAGDKILSLLGMKENYSLTEKEDLSNGINLSKINFAYSGGKPVLKEVSIKIKPNEIIGLAGMSGCGKSTLAKYIADLNSKEITYIGGHEFIFQGTIRENLTMGNEKISDDDIIKVIEETEAVIMRTIEKLKGKKTVIIISHRLENLRFADRIYLLKNGSILEEGNLLKLLEKKGEFYDLWKTQEELEAV